MSDNLAGVTVANSTNDRPFIGYYDYTYSPGGEAQNNALNEAYANTAADFSAQVAGYATNYAEYEANIDSINNNTESFSVGDKPDGEFTPSWMDSFPGYNEIEKATDAWNQGDYLKAAGWWTVGAMDQFNFISEASLLVGHVRVLQYARTGGGGINIYDIYSRRVFAVDYPKYNLYGRSANKLEKLHIHYGTTNSQIKKHRALLKSVLDIFNR